MTEIIAREQALFAARRKVLDSQLVLTQQEIKEAQEEIAARQALDTSARNAVQLMENEVAVHVVLLERGMVSRTQLRGLQRQAAEYHTRTHENMVQLAEVRQRRSTLEGKRASFQGPNLEARQRLIFDLQRYEAEQQYYVYLYAGMITVSWPPYVKNYAPNLTWDVGGRVAALWLER